MRILGIDPGLQKTGWGIIDKNGNSLKFVGCGLIKTKTGLPLYARLTEIDAGIVKVIADFQPDEVAIEETFVNKDPISALKLGQARGVAIASAARTGLAVHEYAANVIKKTVVGAGHASKDQIAMMVRTLLPQSGKVTPDEADALAIAICHDHHSGYNRRIGLGR